MPVKKLSTTKNDTQDVGSFRTNVAGAVTDPNEHYGKGRTISPEEYETAQQTIGRQVLQKWLGRK